MTFNEKKLEEFRNSFSHWKFSPSLYIGLTNFLIKSLHGKEQDTLKRVYGCIMEAGSKKIDDYYVPGANFLLNSINYNLDKEFKQ